MTGRVALVELDEATLVARARDRDPASFELLVRRYQRRIYTLCVRMLDGASGEAEDITQETFVTAWRRLPEIQNDAAFGGWLYRTATNKCLTVLQRRRPTVGLDEHHPAPDDHDPERAAGTTAAMNALSDALRQLPPQQRACWLLREVHGRSYQEIAGLVGTTPTAVRGRIARARAELAEVMKPWK
ncbi:RNA polymerase sigma factor [Kribbella sp. NPDC048928]|uniref:RNA polymerase sigma factor n=1 Tax=Kribbella sp. NPDC048928 TaxID=3364111 RepID=UPI003724566B